MQIQWWEGAALSRAETVLQGTTQDTMRAVDDDIAVRESLDLLIPCQGWKPEAFASAQQFLNRPRPLVPSCLVLDVSIPGFHGLELQKRIAVERANTPIICITSQGDVSTTVKAMKAGALEFLTKPFDDDELLNGIREALERSRVILAHEAEMQTLRDCYATLTHRERQVLALVVASRWGTRHQRDHLEGTPRAEGDFGALTASLQHNL